MKRSRRIVILCHCILNASAIVEGEAAYEGAMREFVEPLIAEGTGIIQLPCPESTFLGLRRCAMTSEQYDTPAFRRHCARRVEPFLDQVQDAVENGVLVLGGVGVKGSPSCGVTSTCTGYGSGTAGKVAVQARRSDGSGVFVEVLRQALAGRGLELPMTDVDNSEPGSASWEATRKKLEGTCQ